MKIELNLPVKGWCRLLHMCDHIAEEAHDMDEEPGTEQSEPWHSEEFWTNLSGAIEEKLNEQGIDGKIIWMFEDYEDGDFAEKDRLDDGAD